MSNQNEHQPQGATLKRALLALEKMQARIDELERAQSEPIAIIGLGCRFPGGVNTLEKFWQLLHDEVDVVSDIPMDRWDVERFYDENPIAPGKMLVRRGAFLDEVDKFDPSFFHISPREATAMDPQQRLLLEVSWEALEYAGQLREKLLGSRTGVFIGMMSQDYAKFAERSAGLQGIDAYYYPGNDFSFAAGRLSYTFGFHGPSMAVDTACSSSLVSVHLACQSLRSGECDMALAGGVSLMLSPEIHIFLSKAGAASPDGRSKTFDAAADGMGRGEGCGVVVLKRLSRALADGDPIAAVIRGSAVNHGGSSGGLTVPNGHAQQALLRQALESARVKHTEVDYIEAHGTGTILGDPIEIVALDTVFREQRERPLLVSSVKPNIGHLDPASGIAGLLKTVALLQHSEIPRQYQLRELNPHIPWQELALEVPRHNVKWEREDTPRIAGVSSFGLSGVNAHVILQDAPPPQPPTALAASSTSHVGPYLLPLSAHNGETLRAVAQSYQQYLATEPADGAGLVDICYTASLRRTHHEQRLSIVGNSRADLADLLSAFLQGDNLRGLAQGCIPEKTPRLAMVFSGQGSQWLGMGRQLFEQHPLFKEVIERCHTLFQRHTGAWSLIQELLADETTSRIQDTEVTQPLLFSIGVALAALWKSWGIVPDVVLGHSIGEVSAAHVAGIFTLEDAVRIVFHRSRLMQRVTGHGKMMLVHQPAEHLASVLHPYRQQIAIAAINNPTTTVLSGESAAIDELKRHFQEQQITCQPLHVNYAFHSLQMDELTDELAASLQGLAPRRATIPFISTVTARHCQGPELTAHYWTRNMRQPVLFTQAIEQALQADCQTFVEISPHPVLALDMAQSFRDQQLDGIVIPSLQRQQDELTQLYAACGVLYCHGHTLNWSAFYPDGGTCVPLPPYPWQRERFWIADQIAVQPAGGTTLAPIGAPASTASHQVREDLQRGRLVPLPQKKTLLTRGIYLQAPADERVALLEEYIAIQIGLVLQLPRHKVVPRYPLHKMGMDSLTALELKNRLERDLEVQISLVFLVDGPTVEQVHVFVSAQLEALQTSSIEAVDQQPLRPATQELYPPAIVPSASDQPAPLSFAQQRLWFLYQLDAKNAAYNESIALRLAGTINTAALVKSLNALVQRHEVLRTNFRQTDDQVVQFVNAFQPFVVPCIDLQNVAAQQREVAAISLVDQEVARLFALEHDPLYRFLLFKLGDNDYILLIVLHHIICDGWSIEILSRELTSLYATFCEQTTSTLPALPVQYRDFATWQRAWLSNDLLQGPMAYWKEQLRGELPLLALPADRPQPVNSQYTGVRHYLRISASLLQRLKQLSQEQGVTLFMTLLAAYQTLLYRYTGQDDVIVGSPISNRSRVELEGLIGFFVNNLVLRTDLAGNPDFLTLLQRVHRVALDAYTHQHVPFEKLVEELQPERQMNRYPLFQVALILQGAMTSEVQLPDVNVSVVPLTKCTARVDLEMHLWESDDALSGFIVYSPEQFDASTIERMISHFTCLLENIIADPTQSIATISLLSLTERRQILQEWSQLQQKAAQPQSCFPQVFERQVACAPDRIAVSFADMQLSYAELDRCANQIAHRLRRQGVGAEVKVGVCVERGLTLILGMLGTLKTGGVYVPLDPGYPQDRVAYMLADAGPRVLITQNSLSESFSDWDGAMLVLDDEWEQLRLEPIDNIEDSLQSQNDAYIIYTSGSTGQPKGVEVTHQGIQTLIDVQRQAFAITGHDHILQFSSMSFDASVWEICMALGNGARLCLASGDELLPSQTLVDLIARQQITIVTLPPSVLAVLSPSRQMASLQTIIVAGEACSINLVHQWAGGRRFYNAYGPTENTVCATMEFCDPLLEQAPPIGRAIHGSETYILDASLQPVPINVAGELCLGGIGLARGYLERPDLTAERFIPHAWSSEAGTRLYRTGDLARYLPDGRIEYLGRIDHQVKVRGFRIELGEIEHVLARHPFVNEVVVEAKESKTGDKRLIAYIVMNGDQQQEGDVDEYVAEWQMLYEEQYSKTDASFDPTFNIAGWNSSYTGLPIQATVMAEQIDQAVERILAVHPERMLEIGCGTGLIMYRVAPHCRYYQATDFSAEVLENLKRLPPTQALPQVEFRQRVADDFSDIAPASLDMVIINSVVQYFPGIDYLGEVVRKALQVVKPGGYIFLGDVRNFKLLAAYHTSVEMYQADDDLTREEALQRVHTRVLHEEELLIDPAWFAAFLEQQGVSGQVQIQLKRGLVHNELTRFRYDVLLRVGSDEEQRDEIDETYAEWNWQHEKVTTSALRTYLIDTAPSALKVINIGNARLRAESQALQWLQQEGTPLPTVGAWRTAQDGCEVQDLDPEEIWQLAERAGYHALISWSHQGNIGNYDVLFYKHEHPWHPTYGRLVPTGKKIHEESWRAYANDPLQEKMAHKVIPQLRAYLQEKLPEYMVPAAFVTLDAMPLTPSKKIDRRALPAVTEKTFDVTEQFVAPRTPTEHQLATIWEQLLGLKGIGLHDNFFTLGGHSLLATQIVSQIRTHFHVELPLRCLWSTPTVEMLAQAIDEQIQQRQALQAPQLIPLQPGEEEKLSFAQQRLWFLHQLEPDTATYNMPAAVRLRGSLDVHALLRSWQALITRHEALRTQFVARDGKPGIVVRDTLPLPLTYIDLTHLPTSQRESEAKSLADTGAQTLFDLEAAPLISCLLLRLGQQEYVFVCTLHHSIVDGWSVGILIKEFIQYYIAFVTGTTPELPALPLTYREFARWQRQWLQGNVLETQRTYWIEQLADLPVLNMPTDRPRPAVQSYRGAVQRFVIPTRLHEQLKELCLHEDVTLFMALLAVFQILLKRYCAQDDIVVGTDIANRNYAETEGIVGFFVNTLVLRTKLGRSSSFRDVLARVREVCLEAYAHQDIPFEYLVNDLQPERDLSRNPLFQIHFAVQNSPVGVVNMHDVILQMFDVHNATSKFDISMNLVELEHGLNGTIEYCTDLFDDATIARLVRHFSELIQHCLAQPDQPLDALPLLIGAERQRLLVEWNQTSAPFPFDQCFHNAFTAQALRTPDAVAIAYQGRTLTYRELDVRSNQLAHLLRQQGVENERPVGLCMQRSIAMLVSILAIFKAGGVYVPLDQAYPAKRIRWMMDDAHVSVVLTQPDLALPMAATLITLDDELDVLNGYSERALEHQGWPGQLAYIIYTSGSTGMPKGVMISHRGMLNHLYAKIDDLQLRTSDRIAQTASHCFDISVWQFLSALLVGGQTHIIPDEIAHDPIKLKEQIIAQGLTIVEIVPTLLRVWLDSEGAQVDSTRLTAVLRYLVVTGEACPSDLGRCWLEKYHGIPLMNAYGPTECSDDVTHAILRQTADLTAGAALVLGKAIANTQLYVLNHHLEPVPIGVAGEVYVGGTGVGRGYLGRAAQTALAFVPHPFATQPGERLYKTGDLARYLADGQLEFLGRIDDQVKVRGFRIELGEIEARLRQHPAIQACVVMVKSSSSGGDKIVAYVVAGAPHAYSEVALRSFLQDALPEYMVPHIFVQLRELPLTPNGKIDRQALPEPDFGRSVQDSKTCIGPRNAVEELLTGIWEEIFGLPSVSIRDNFFALGGDSIVSIQIVARANQVGIRLTPKLLFKHQTIEELSAAVDLAPMFQAEQGLVLGEVPLTPIEHWFFEQHFTYAHHWNQSMWLEVRQPINLAMLRAAIKMVLVHHDMLRVQFEPSEQGGMQVLTTPPADIPLTCIDVAGLTWDEQEERMLAVEAEQQGSMHLSQSPLLRAVLFTDGHEQPARLLLIIHHLSIDGVSWRILLEDLETAYRQLMQGTHPRLPAKTSSFKQWAERLQQYGQSEITDQERAYWTSDRYKKVASLPVAYSACKDENVESSLRAISASLSEDDTRVLLEQLPTVFQTQINDVLLTALALVCRHWIATPLLIELEGHGREELFDDVSTARTVGWFTSQYPVVLDIHATTTESEALQAVKEQLRAIPQHGIGYGILRYLGMDQTYAALLQQMPAAEILFNYLGQFDQTLMQSDVFALLGQSAGPLHHPDEKRSHLLEITCLIQHKQLQVHWMYSVRFHTEVTMRDLVARFMQSLRSLIEDCRTRQASSDSLLADFSDLLLDQDQLESIIAEIDLD